jgi:hypothetical protein
MHPLRALRERGHNTSEEVSALPSDDIQFHTPILTKAVTGRELIGRIWADQKANWPHIGRCPGGLLGQQGRFDRADPRSGGAVDWP